MLKPTLPPAMQSAMPLIKLTQANMDLLTQFSMSPEVLAKPAAATQNLLQQGQQAATDLLQSNAFALLTQGILKNYTEFVMEVGQGGMAALAKAQADLVRQTQDVTAGLTESSQAGSRRAR
jgi:hypothetical protein